MEKDRSEGIADFMRHACGQAPQQGEVLDALGFALQAAALLFGVLAFSHFLTQCLVGRRQGGRALLDTLFERGISLLERPFSPFAPGNVAEHSQMQPGHDVRSGPVFDLHGCAIFPL